MKTTITAQQTAFFTKNGFIEFAIPHLIPPESPERDQWRKNEEFKQLIIRKLAPIALTLTGKKQLRLGLDQWITTDNRPEKACTLKDMFSIQGFALAAVLAENPVLPATRSPLGILPLPSNSESILFFRPDLILDWPHISSNLLLVLFTLSTAVYVHNTKDPSTYFLKQFGYNYGDTLKSETHPLIYSASN